MTRFELMFLDFLGMISDPKYYVPFFIFVGVYLGILIAKKIVINRLERIAQMTETYIDDIVLAVLKKTKHFFILGAAIYSGLLALHLNKRFEGGADKIFLLLFSIQAIIWGTEAINRWIDFTISKKDDDPSVKTSLGFVGLLLKFVFIAGLFLFALNNLGVNVSTFVTGLGVGGVAIALATQNILGDLFSSLSIVMDKPFVVGDAISLGEWTGTIEHVGLKTTRLRSLSGEQIVISNSDLLSSKIRNYKRMVERRVVFQLGLTYQTKRDDLKNAPGLLEEIIKNQKHTRFDRAHFVRYGNFSLDIEVVYWILSPDYKVYADIHQEVLFHVHEVFEKNNLNFAYPTQTVIIEKNGPAEV